jgi:hypothetical protein
LVKKLFFSVVALFVAFAVAFAIAEAAVRLISPQEVGPVRFTCHPELGEIPVPGQQGQRNAPGGFSFRYHNNSLGWRGPWEYRPAKRTDYRVLFLGDSFTYGIGVNDDQTFPLRIEQKLNAANISVEALNGGCPGKGTDYAVKLFETVGAKFHPDLTVLSFFRNDFQDNARGKYYDINKQGKLSVKPLQCNRIKKMLAHLPGYNWLISWSQAANLVKQAGVNLLVNRASKGGSDAADGLVVSYQPRGGGYADRANQELTRIYVEHLNTAVTQAGGALMIVYIPNSEEVTEYRRARTISADERVMQRLAADNGISLWSLTPLLAHSGQPIERLYYQEGHWTAAAHDTAARFLSRLIHHRLLERRQIGQ